MAANVVIVEVEALVNARARTVARQALGRPDWAFWCITGWPAGRQDEARATVMGSLRVQQVPKTAPVMTCGHLTASGTRQAKLTAFVEVMGRVPCDNLVVFDVDRDQLDLYAGWLAGRRQPYRWTLYWTQGKLVAPYRSTAVHAVDAA